MLVHQIIAAFGVAPETAQRIVRRVRDASIDWSEISLSSRRKQCDARHSAIRAAPASPRAENMSE
jgi:hypothetical protein